MAMTRQMRGLSEAPTSHCLAGIGGMSDTRPLCGFRRSYQAVNSQNRKAAT